MTKKKGQSLSQMFTIPANKIDVNKIVHQIKTDIKKKRLDYVKDLNNAVPDIIDVWENSEFLLEGWYEPENICNTRARWTKKKFSFLFNVKNSKQVSLELVGFTNIADSKPIKASLTINGEKTATTSILKNKSVTFSIPAKYQNKLATYEIKLSRSFKKSRSTFSDPRDLGLPIKAISNHETSIAGKTYLPKIQDGETNLQFLSEKVNYHQNPVILLPLETRFKFIKKFILKILKPYTSVQIAFNKFTSDYAYNLNQVIHDIISYIKTLDLQIKELKNLVKGESKTSIFYHDHHDKFYKFQQNKFRGTYKNIQKKQKKYLKYLKNIKQLNKKYSFLEIGFGRGEFLELLKQNSFKNVIGIDINREYIKEAEKKGYIVKQVDIVEFMIDYQNKISGASLFHILEHLEFDKVFDLLYLLYQKLAKNGVVIIETPNTENLQVGSNSFFYDSTHKTKLPPLFLKTVFEYIGFNDIKIIKSSPIKPKLSKKDEIKKLIFGNQDYAIIAYK